MDLSQSFHLATQVWAQWAHEVCYAQSLCVYSKKIDLPLPRLTWLNHYSFWAKNSFHHKGRTAMHLCPISFAQWPLSLITQEWLTCYKVQRTYWRLIYGITEGTIPWMDGILSYKCRICFVSQAIIWCYLAYWQTHLPGIKSWKWWCLFLLLHLITPWQNVCSHLSPFELQNFIVLSSHGVATSTRAQIMVPLNWKIRPLLWSMASKCPWSNRQRKGRGVPSWDNIRWFSRERWFAVIS